jgi:hypothetical protein
MDFKSTIDLIIRDLNEASEIIDDLKKYPGVPVLQVELAKSKCRSAGEVIGLLKSLSFTETITEKPVQEKEVIQTHEQPAAPEPQPKISQPVHTSEKKAEPKVTVKKQDEASSIADKFTRSADLYDEKLSNLKTEKDISDRLKVKPVTTLTEAIGISDKFLFISEIFNGNKETYTHAIARLDKAESLKDAMAIIVSYTGENTESEAVSQLLELVKLKLPSNE